MNSEKKLTFQEKYLEDSVYGASDGIVTTFAVVAGVSGASLAPVIVLILGFANLIADGFSMAVGKFLSLKSEGEFKENQRKKELGLVNENPSYQKKVLRNILEKKGFKGKLLTDALNAMTKNKEVWIDCIITEGFGLSSGDESPFRHSVATFSAFVIAGLMPMLSYVLAEFIPAMKIVTFEIAMIFTAMTLVIVGILKSYVTKRIWYKEAFDMLFLGGAAAVLAYYVGYFLSLLV